MKVRECRNYYTDYGIETRIARFYNIYGPNGTWTGGREKSPAAICRGVAEQPSGTTIEIWRDGKQTRSYRFINDCLEGIYGLTQLDYIKPLNIGSDRIVSIDELTDIIIGISGKKIYKKIIYPNHKVYAAGIQIIPYLKVF